jgi:hypothetical protein
MVGTKVALTLALTVPLDWRRPPEYWALAPFPGLEPGPPQILQLLPPAPPHRLRTSPTAT